MARGASAIDRAVERDLHSGIDSDWAGSRGTRRSCIVYKGVCLNVWSSTHHHLALSSGEAEYVLRCYQRGSEGRYLDNLCRDLGLRTRVVVHRLFGVQRDLQPR